MVKEGPESGSKGWGSGARRQALEAMLCCPKCKGDLVHAGKVCTCIDCDAGYSIRDGKFYFIEAGQTTDRVDLLKSVAKRIPRLYALASKMISPVLYNESYIPVVEQTEGFIINLGSGNLVIGENVINVDMIDYENVHVIADIEELPFRPETIDCAVSLGVLEHVRRPDQVIRECYRVLKRGGTIFSVIPFMQPFHASPYDYQRYSKPGIEHLHRQFESIRSGTYGGPVSGFLWIFQEFVALLFSFGVKPVRDAIYLIVMFLTWPIKFLDYIFRRLPTAENIASSFYYYGRKGKVDLEVGLEQQSDPHLSAGDVS